MEKDMRRRNPISELLRRGMERRGQEKIWTSPERKYSNHQIARVSGVGVATLERLAKPPPKP